MHATLAELLENLKPGLLWVNREGVVRYANGLASARTGLAAGRKLYDPDLTRAVAAAVADQGVRAVDSVAPQRAAGGDGSELKCRVLPGLARDDAFVLIGADGASDAGIAFDNLMMVIRTELRDPLRRARGEQSAPAASGGANGGGPLHEVLAVLDKLVDLADVWGSDTLAANDRIEPWPLLQKVWNQLEPLARERSITVRFRPHGQTDDLAAIYGSARWLERVFVECLEAALRDGRRGATLDIEYRQLGPRALVIFRDCGVFAGAAADAMALERTAPAGSARPQAREHIGLKLCEHIVALHGGRLREEHEEGQRHFLIDLPTGAPHRNETTQLDIAQAQRYASDLAALMARARTRGRAA